MTLNIATRDAVFQTILGVQTKYKRTYSQVKRVTIQNLIFKFYKIRVCLSTIDYHLGVLKKAGLINVYRRRGRDENGRFFNLASNRQITGKGLYYFKKIGKHVASYLTAWAYKGVKPKRQKPKSNNPIAGIFEDPPAREAADTFVTLGSSLISALNHIS